MRESAWGLLIVIYLFCGGLSGGVMMLAAAAHLFGRTPRHTSIARLGALASPVPVILGTALLVFDLGRPLFFWKLFLAIKPLSPMWFGSWLLALFSIVSLAYAYLFLAPRWQHWPVRHPDRWQRRLAVAGLPLGLSVAVYTAVLIGVLVARPLWNTPLIALLFVLSALSSAAALLMVLGPRDELGELSRLDALLLFGEAVVLAGILLYGMASLTATRHAVGVLARDFPWSFWGGVVVLGLLVPLTVEVSAVVRGRVSRLAMAVAAWLVLLGGFLLRYVLVYAGQSSGL